MVDSLDLTVMYLLTCVQRYRSKSYEGEMIKNHEIFDYIHRFYGFPLSFMTEAKLFTLLIKRLEEGQLENLSLSLILLAKRTSQEFSLNSVIRGNLLPMLNRIMSSSINKLSDEILELQQRQMCLLIEVISTVIKPFPTEKEKSFKEIFPMIISVLSRTKSIRVKEICIKAILRLQRFIDNHKEVFEIVKHHLETSGTLNEGLRYAVSTFMHRKNEKFFEK